MKLPAWLRRLLGIKQLNGFSTNQADISDKAHARFAAYFRLFTNSELVINVGLQQEEGCHPDMTATNSEKKRLTKQCCEQAILDEIELSDDLDFKAMLREELRLIKRI